MNRKLDARLVLSAVALALFLSACGREAATPKEAVAEKKPSGPAAAKVNGTEIPLEQVNALLSRAGNVPAEQSKAASRQLLERLIDQEILLQKAAESKLDQDPKVIQAIDTARREVLTRAYLEQAAAGAAKPGEQEIKDYYDKHPELFKERRVYNLREIAINAPQDTLPALQEQMAKSKSLNDVVNWLKSKDIQFATNQGAKAAEQLPLEVLPKFHQLKDGQTAILPMPAGILVVQVVASQTQPLDETQARPFIEQFLTNQRRTESAAAAMKTLREAAKVEYLGDYAKSAEEGKSVMEGAPSAPATAAPADKGAAK
jgi:EpsD family peptidyl-prolyl cis-trans isomerase